MRSWTKVSTILGVATGTLLFGGVAALATNLSVSGSSGPASFGADASTSAGAEVVPPQVTPPSVTDPQITPPSVTEPQVTAPSVSEPRVTPPSVSAAPPSVDIGDDAVEITVPLPTATEPHVEGGEVSGPHIEGPHVTEPHIEGPQVTEPQIEDPAVKINPTELEVSGGITLG